MSKIFRRLFEGMDAVSATSDKRDRGEGEPWMVHESRLTEGYRNMNQDFAPVIPQEYHDIKEYVEEELSDKRGQAVGIEIGGTGSQLFRDFTPGFFKRSLGTALNDLRNGYEASVDRELGHSVIETDVFHSSGKLAIEKWLQGEKADFIIERMVAGTAMLPENAKLSHLFLDRFYRMLSDNGILLMESQIFYSPHNVARVLNGLDEIKRRYPMLDITYHEKGKAGQNMTIYQLVLRLQKDPRGPDSLSTKPYNEQVVR